MTNYNYKPIGPGFVRLLRLLKGDDDSIKCQLFEQKLASLEHIKDYAALSYTWGSTSRPCDIMINERKTTVTKNVYLALQDLRSREKDQVLWIDALCIDQNNDEERGQQVQQMGSIYSKAERVIIWLGEATHDTDYVMHYMKKLEKEEEDIKHTSNDQKISDKQWIDIWSMVVHHLRADQRDVLVEGLRLLLGRSWFKRVWIIQETANARISEIVCGSKSISASIFALMPSLLGITPDPHCQPVLDIMPGCFRNSSWWAKKRDLCTMLARFSESEATDPRDKIYALLGISSDTCDTDLLKPNYGKHLQDVIFDTTSFLLDFNKLDTPIYRFFDWTLPEFLGNLNILANEVLKCAMKTRHEAVGKLLLETGKVDVDSNDYYRRMPLVWAAMKGHEAVVKLLLETGKMDVDWKYGHNGRTPLLLAARNGHEAVVKLLLETGKVDVDSDDGHGRTPLSWAAGNGHEAVMKLLLETGKVGVGGYSGRTPLWWAAQNGHEVAVKLLLETGKVDVDRMDGYYRRTPLWWAVVNGHEAVVKLLLETDKVEVDRRDDDYDEGGDGRTPLSWAAENGHEAVAKLLLETGKVKVNSIDHYGRTPLWWAAQNGHEVVVRLLQSFVGT